MAFVRPIPLLRRHPASSLAHTSRPCSSLPPQREHVRRRRVSPSMISGTTVATELLALSAVGAATYYFFTNGPPASSNKPEETGSSEQSTPADTAAPEMKQSEDRAVLGLSTTTSDVEATTETLQDFETGLPIPPSQLEPSRPTFSPDDSVGVDINDYMDLADTSLFPDRARRLDEELAWAIAALLDLADCDGVAILDARRRIVLADGDLIADDTSRAGSVLLGVSSSRQRVVMDVDGNKNLPFLSEDVRSVAALPVAAEGAAVLLASRESDFFGAIEDRVASAVCERLSPFLYVPPALES